MIRANRFARIALRIAREKQGSEELPGGENVENNLNASIADSRTRKSRCSENVADWLYSRVYCDRLWVTPTSLEGPKRRTTEVKRPGCPQGNTGVSWIYTDLTPSLANCRVNTEASLLTSGCIFYRVSGSPLLTMVNQGQKKHKQNFL